MTKTELEKQILDILLQCEAESSMSHAAKEIASMFEGYYEKEFVEWKDNKKIPFKRQINSYDFIGCYYTLDELYAYWQKEVRYG